MTNEVKPDLIGPKIRTIEDILTIDEFRAALVQYKTENNLLKFTEHTTMIAVAKYITKYEINYNDRMIRYKFSKEEIRFAVKTILNLG